jgi:heat shock protein HslJ
VVGCRSFKATYEATDDDLYFPSTEMTSLECMRPRATAQEIYFFEGAGTRYRLSPDQLEIFPVEGGSLVFERLPEETTVEQQQTVWTLEAFEENGSTTPVPAGVTITLSFDGDTLREQGRVAGSAGCNRYTGPYTYVNELTLGAIAVTRMACPPPIMEQEQRFLDVLQAVKTYSLEDQLRLQTADGRALVFRVK